MTPVWIVLGVLLICGLYFALEVVNAPTLPDFDEHAATACALLQPDHPRLPADTPHADAIEAWLRSVTPQES